MDKIRGNDLGIKKRKRIVSRRLFFFDAVPIMKVGVSGISGRTGIRLNMALRFSLPFCFGWFPLCFLFLFSRSPALSAAPDAGCINKWTNSVKGPQVVTQPSDLAAGAVHHCVEGALGK